ncbi:MAG: agmatine deiminase family protein [Bacteroidia bacterium]|nr:agmatine deiminase family protein [Bacteroidia bacterium]
MTFPDHPTPKALGYRFPAEWEPHAATWLSWPHKEESWPGKIETIYPIYAEFIALLTLGEEVHINVGSSGMAAAAHELVEKAGANMQRVFFHLHPTNDAWCRDHGPAFLLREGKQPGKALVDWGYNAWGDKYPPYDLDNKIPEQIATFRGIPRFEPGIVMEGGSIEVNGAGTLLTTKACLLNKNRNPHLSQDEIESYLREYYGQDQILWLNDGIIGDDTDGHIDDLTRFVSEDTVVTVVESNPEDENYAILQENLEMLHALRLPDGRALNIVELPMPDPVIYDGQRLPASYANFYIGNAVVVVPTFRCEQDLEALRILRNCFTDRLVVGLDSTDIIWGLGSFHCLSQQEPLG